MENKNLTNMEKKKLTEENGDSWRDYKLYLLNSIEVINYQLKEHRKDVTDLKISLSEIATTMGAHSKLWGAISGVGSALLVLLIARAFKL